VNSQNTLQSELYKHCCRCFRKIYSPLSIARGYGPVCYRKMQIYEGRPIDLNTVRPIPLPFEDQTQIKDERKNICQP